MLLNYYKYSVRVLHSIYIIFKFFKMPDCFAKNCKSRKSQNRKNKMQLQWEHFYDKKISFHRIPMEPQQRQKWLDAMELPDNIPKNAFICSLHFQEDDLDRTSLACTRVRPGAIPLKNLGIGNEPLVKRQKVSDKCLIEVENLSDAEKENCNVQSTNIFEAVETKSTIISTSIQDDTYFQHSNIAHCSNVSDKEINVSPKLSENTPRKQMLKTVLRNTRKGFMKKIRVLQQKQRRTMKCVARLKDLLASLKKNNLLHAEQLDVLKDIGNFNQELLKRQINKLNKTQMPKKYKAELRAFALTLHYYSPRAYAFVRKKFNTCLPHPKTICKWYKSVNGEPGFNEEALQSIKKRAELVKYPLFGALIFDEVAIRQHVEYDGKKYSGYIDLGPDIQCDYGTIAKDRYYMFKK